jgi:hypothetical protein
MLDHNSMYCSITNKISSFLICCKMCQLVFSCSNLYYRVFRNQSILNIQYQPILMRVVSSISKLLAEFVGHYFPVDCFSLLEPTFLNGDNFFYGFVQKPIERCWVFHHDKMADARHILDIEGPSMPPGYLKIDDIA